MYKVYIRHAPHGGVSEVRVFSDPQAARIYFHELSRLRVDGEAAVMLRGTEEDWRYQIGRGWQGERNDWPGTQSPSPIDPSTRQGFRAARVHLGMSLEDMARALRVSSGRTVRRWEAGDRDIPGPAVVAVSQMLGISFDDSGSS